MGKIELEIKGITNYKGKRNYEGIGSNKPSKIAGGGLWGRNRPRETISYKQKRPKLWGGVERRVEIIFRCSSPEKSSNPHYCARRRGGKRTGRNIPW